MITSKGYKITLNEENTKHAKACILRSKIKSDYPGPPLKIICYRKSPYFYYLPRHYGISYLGYPKEEPKYTQTPIDVTFNGSLREYQKEVITKTQENFQNKELMGGVWSLSTGFGKTGCALYMISLMKVKTIIIVHKQVLLDQWIERIEQFLPNARIGLIQGPIIDTEDKDIILAMIQTLSRKDHPKETFKDISFLIVDECHMICSKTFNSVLFKIQTKYRLGLSATPERKDGFDKVLNFHLGPIIISKHNNLYKPEIEVYKTPSTDVSIELNRFGKVNSPKLITDIALDKDRNEFIISILLEKVKEDRKILVFSDRVAQCEYLNESFSKKEKVKESDTFIGKKKKHELNKALEADVIFATYGICKEGFDCPRLDTLLFATPKSDVVQAVGRILRQQNKRDPLVLDLLDNSFGNLKGQYYKRKKWYHSKDYQVTFNGEQVVKKKEEYIEPIRKCLIK